MHQRRRALMSSSNEDRGVETSTNVNDEDGMHGGMKSDLFGAVDANFDLSETGALTGSKKEGGGESERPGLAFRQISAGSADLLGYAKSLNEKEAPSKDAESGTENWADLPSHRRVDLSPKPTERDGAGSGKIGAPAPFLSPDALALARLYHSSRRSRHQSPKGSAESTILPSKELSLPPPSCSFSWDIQRISRERSGADNDKEKESEWSFHISSPIHNSCSSSNASVSSMESEEPVTGETEVGGELFGEEDDVVGRQAKRQKTAPGK